MAALLSSAAMAACAETAIDLDPSKTEINFTLHDMIHKVHGSFQLKRGSLHFDPDNGKASGEIVIDVASGESGSRFRDRRMHRDVLESERYPEAIFTPIQCKASWSRKGNPRWTCMGS